MTCRSLQWSPHSSYRSCITVNSAIFDSHLSHHIRKGNASVLSNSHTNATTEFQPAKSLIRIIVFRWTSFYEEVEIYDDPTIRENTVINKQWRALKRSKGANALPTEGLVSLTKNHNYWMRIRKSIIIKMGN